MNAKIYRLILDFEEEETAFLMRRIDTNEAIRQRSSQILGIVAAGAVVLMLLFVAVLWRDINRSVRYRRALERANRDNEALLAAREQLMLAITHDIKAPLGSVMGYIDLLSRLTSDKRQELYLQNMKSSSEHLLALVNSLLDFYRLDANKMEVDAVAFNPAQLFETIRAGFAAAAAAKGLELRLELAPGTDREVAGDAFRIRQIADNLLSNALKFTDEGFVTLRTRLSDGQLVFSVRDTGRGIGPEERERIFAEFVRLRSAQGVDGFGLGLSIVDRLVKLLGGAISLDSAPGQGSKFIVTVPVGDAAEGAAGRTAAPEPGAAEPLPPLRALLVDDDPCNSKWSPPCAAARGFRPSAANIPNTPHGSSRAAASIWSSPTSRCPRTTDSVCWRPCAASRPGSPWWPSRHAGRCVPRTSRPGDSPPACASPSPTASWSGRSVRPAAAGRRRRFRTPERRHPPRSRTAASCASTP